MAEPVNSQTDPLKGSTEPVNAIPPKRPMTVHAKATPKKDTSRIELSDAEAPTEAPGETLTIKDALGGASRKSETSRISLTDARAAAEQDDIPKAKDSTARILFGDAAGETVDESTAKDTTARIVLGAGAAYGNRPYAAAKDATVRVDLTGLIEQGGRPSAADSSQAPVRLPGADQTARIEIPAADASSAPPRTVRLQRPSASPKTVVLKRPGESAAPQTVVLQRPPTVEEEQQKSSTARISIPESAIPSAPSSQRKTIMIKRSGGPSSSIRTLSMRPSSSVTPASGARQEDMEEILASLQNEDEPGVLYGILALVAVLVMAVLVYVLAAQTIAPTLPFPGRIG